MSGHLENSDTLNKRTPVSALNTDCVKTSVRFIVDHNVIGANHESMH